MRVLRVEEVLAEKGKNPVEEVLKLMPELKPAEQARTWLELLKYLQPQKKELAVTDGDEDEEPLTEEQRAALVKAAV